MDNQFQTSNRMQRFTLLFAISLVAVSWTASAATQADDGVLYKAGKVYTMTGEPISPGQVLVVDGKIKAVGTDVAASGAKVVDLGEDSVLLPGLVDAYSQTGLGSAGTDETTNEVTPDFKAITSVDWDKPALQRQLEQGTTSMCVCPGTQNVIAGTAAIIKTNQPNFLLEDGPLLASMCSDPASRNRSRQRPDSIYVRQPTNRMGVVWILRNTFSKATRDKDPKNYPVVKQTLSGKRPLMMVSRLSHDLNTVATLADEFGFSPIVVGGQEAYKVKDMLAERKYPLILQSVGSASINGPERSELCWNQASLLAEDGITFAFSGNDLLEQARFAHRNGLNKNRALESITSTPASLLGIDKRVGTIAVGKDADLVALNGEPLEFTTSILWVMVDGQTIEMDKGK